MILVTGASGNVGREVLGQIVKTGRNVRAAYQSVEKAKMAPAGVEGVVVDFNRSETLRAALEGVERVFLVGPPAETITELERKATDAIKRSGVRQLVKLSAMGTRAATFPRLHAESEDYIKDSGVGYTFLRPNGFMQNLGIYSSGTIREEGTFYGCQGEGKVSQIDLRDVGAVAVKVLTGDHHVGKTYTLTGPVAFSNSHAARILSATFGREIRYVDLTPEQFGKAMLGAGVPEWSVNALVSLYQLYREGGASAVSGDVQEILGRRAIHFEAFAQDFAKGFK
jgi:uncharacterized protein YbjT (DUF2867 family)